MIRKTAVCIWVVFPGLLVGCLAGWLVGNAGIDEIVYVPTVFVAAGGATWAAVASVNPMSPVRLGVGRPEASRSSSDVPKLDSGPPYFSPDRHVVLRDIGMTSTCLVSAAVFGFCTAYIGDLYPALLGGLAVGGAILISHGSISLVLYAGLRGFLGFPEVTREEAGGRWMYAGPFARRPIEVSAPRRSWNMAGGWIVVVQRPGSATGLLARLRVND